MSQFLKSYQITNDRIETEKRLPTDAKARLEQIRQDNLKLLDSNTFLIGTSDKLQQGDFDYEEQQRPDNETLGHYAEQLREELGV